MNALIKILEYLKQPSTWKGLITIVTMLGVTLSSEQTEAIITAGVTLIGLIEVFRNEKK